jgi:hypothetical protein
MPLQSLSAEVKRLDDGIRKDRVSCAEAKQRLLCSFAIFISFVNVQQLIGFFDRALKRIAWL